MRSITETQTSSARYFQRPDAKYLSVDSSLTKLAGYGGTYHGSGDAKSMSAHEYYGEINYKPTNSLSISFDPDYGIQNYELQYVSTTTSDGNPLYLFSKLNQKTLSFTFRINYTINPELSIEYYGQPFVSAGKYSAFKKITQPDAGKFRERFYEYTPEELTYDSSTNTYNVNDGETLSFGNPDFNFRQFRSNLVVRWEYLPGSTIYLVWSQGRTSNDTNGLFSYGTDMKDLFKITPHNVFLIKFSYWFAL